VRPLTTPRLPSWLTRPPAQDIAITAIAVLIAVLVMRTSPPVLKPLGGATTAGQVTLAVLLLWRRRSPLVVVWIVTLAAVAITLAETVAPGSLVPPDLPRTKIPWVPPAAPFAVYSAVLYGRNRRSAWAAVLVLLVLGTHFWNAPMDPPWPLQSLIFIGGPALLGMYVAARQRLLRSLVDRAERAEREQTLLAERVLAEERSRVAAEMHDVVTHRVSLMVLQAGALRVSTQDRTVRAAAEELRRTGCRALEELRDLVGLLHGSTVGVIGESVAPEPGAPAFPGSTAASGVAAAKSGADLSALVNESRAVGVSVNFVEQGNPATIAPIVARTAHRVVQEALTNVRKHAPGASVQVNVRYGAEGVRLRIRNSPPSAPVDPALTAAGSGTGLAGLRQRIDLIHGVLDAGPVRDSAQSGGFQVEAILPADVPAPATLETTP
jgi:signal transduction histidine kinase